jgi:hypothetical protein
MEQEREKVASYTVVVAGGGGGMLDPKNTTAKTVCVSFFLGGGVDNISHKQLSSYPDAEFMNVQYR